MLFEMMLIPDLEQGSVKADMISMQPVVFPHLCEEGI